MSALRFAFPFSYLFFVTLLACTVLFYDSLELTQPWALSLIVPAMIMAFAAFVAVPLYDWLRLPPNERNRTRPRHLLYRGVLALVMLVAPLALARPVLETLDTVLDAIFVATVVLLVLNTTMLLFAGYFIDEPDNS